MVEDFPIFLNTEDILSVALKAVFTEKLRAIFFIQIPVYFFRLFVHADMPFIPFPHLEKIHFIYKSRLDPTKKKIPHVLIHVALNYNKKAIPKASMTFRSTP